ncbi:MAG: hypothetical protein O2780_08475, partial [Proteobacteria bacterium]|nr:hypothetical protein [Pseudomonadota bacterium]
LDRRSRHFSVSLCVVHIPNGQAARFFGVEALTGEMVRRYVEQTGCEVVIAICLRTRAGFRIQFCSTAISSDADPTRAMNEALERVIDGSPEQYLWSYKRFRTRPDSEAELYRLRQGGISRAATQVSLGTMLQLGQWIRPGDQLIRSLAWALGAVRPALKRSSIQNLMLCRPELAREVREELANASLRELVRTGLALPRAWRDSGTSQDAFNGTELLGNGATIVLTPPLGHRELVMDYLGKHHHTLEYYHPNSSDGLDRLIRRQRTAMGVALVPHTTSGEMMMANHLTMGHLVTLCPDQQPRLRGGLFIPFFGAPALTAAAIARILKSVAPTLVFGFAVREGSRYRIQFEPCPYDPLDDPETLLGTINRALESIILRFPEQYRWSDRRFNIRPPGHHKIYR